MKNTVSCVYAEPELESIKNAFVYWFNNTIADSDCPKLTEQEIYISWFCKILENIKMVISTTRPDHTCYEVTYIDKDKKLYIDVYKKFDHDSINITNKECEEENIYDTVEDMFNRSIANVFNSIF